MVIKNFTLLSKTLAVLGQFHFSRNQDRKKGQVLYGFGLSRQGLGLNLRVKEYFQ